MSLRPTLHLLSYQVKILSIDKNNLPLVTHSLLRITLKLLDDDPSYRRDSFYCFTETSSEYSLLLDKKLYEELKLSSSFSNVNVAEGTWRPLVIEVGAFGSLSGISKIAASVIGPLADEGVSVFCLSSNQEDYVMVKETNIESALKCLSRRFKLISDSNLSSDVRLLDSITSSSSSSNSDDYYQPSSSLHYHSTFLSRCTDCENNARPITHPFVCSPVKLHICSVLTSVLSAIAQPLLQRMFFNSSTSKENPFFSFSVIGDNVSLVINSTDVKTFPSDCVYGSDVYWRLFTIGNGPLGFEECGIVAQISSPLADEEISAFYMCTYNTDHILVSEPSASTALKILNKLTSPTNNNYAISVN